MRNRVKCDILGRKGIISEPASKAYILDQPLRYYFWVYEDSGGSPTTAKFKIWGSKQGPPPPLKLGKNLVEPPMKMRI